MNRISNLLFLLFIFCSPGIKAQKDITNAFDDLKRKGTMKAKETEMTQPAPKAGIEKLLQEHPSCGYFCFTEDRLHDIRLNEVLPERWIKRTSNERTHFKGDCMPGEFFSWQIGVYAPYRPLHQLSVTFSELMNEEGDRIPATANQCFNQGGTGTNGQPFRKELNVAEGYIQPLWIGTDIPQTAKGHYRGKVTIQEANRHPVVIQVELTVDGSPIENHGDNEGWRKTRLRWLNSTLGHADIPTVPYSPLELQGQTIHWLGGKLELNSEGLPSQIITCYDQSNQLDSTVSNPILQRPISFIIETATGIETFKSQELKIIRTSSTSIDWKTEQKSKNFELTCSGTFGFDGIGQLQLQVKTRRNMIVKDIRLEVPYTDYASKYLMGLGHKGGHRPEQSIDWHWDINKHQDKIWMGNVNAGLNFRFRDNHYTRPLVNIYYSLGKLNLPTSWGNANKGGIRIQTKPNEETILTAYSGERQLHKGDTLYYNFDIQVTPVKPINLQKHIQARFYHSNSDISAEYIPEALKAGANLINIHHKKDVYPFINYPYYDEAIPELKQLIDEAHEKNLGVRVYYTTRELTVKIPELWALRSLGNEVIHDGPGKDTRTLIHKNGPNEWLNKNLVTHFIPAWYNAFKEGKYAGDMDISVITTPDSRWNNYYLAGLDWMVKHLGVDGIYIDDSALDRQTLQRARRILDQDHKQRLIDIHSWNHMNSWAGYANSLHLYTELLPYVDRTWLGEGFKADNTPDFWFIEMSGIPFGLLSETLDARNPYRGMIYAMLPRLPWSGNPVPLWHLWDSFGMAQASLRGYWDERCPVKTGNDHLPATVYINKDKALVVIANWTNTSQNGRLLLDEQLLGFHPTSAELVEIENIQAAQSFNLSDPFEVAGQKGLFILLSK